MISLQIFKYFIILESPPGSPPLHCRRGVRSDGTGDSPVVAVYEHTADGAAMAPSSKKLQSVLIRDVNRS